MTKPLVIKVGGSLLGWSGLPDRLRGLLHDRRQERLVFVAGGGASADFVRGLDRVHRLGEETSHALALHAMDLTAEVLVRLVPDLVTAWSSEDLEAIWDSGRSPVLAPRRMLETDERSRPAEALPHSWNVTSDTISARIARLLGASGLLLVKSTEVPEGTDLETSAGLGLVDPAFPSEALHLPAVWCLNLRDPSARFLEGVICLSRNCSG